MIYPTAPYTTKNMNSMQKEFPMAQKRSGIGQNMDKKCDKKNKKGDKIKDLQK